VETRLAAAQAHSRASAAEASVAAEEGRHTHAAQQVRESGSGGWRKMNITEENRGTACGRTRLYACPFPRKTRRCVC
jgi:hypothetical protein